MLIIEIILACIAGFGRGWGGYAVIPGLITLIIGILAGSTMRSESDFREIMPMLQIMDIGVLLFYIAMCIIPRSAIIKDEEDVPINTVSKPFSPANNSMYAATTSSQSFDQNFARKMIDPNSEVNDSKAHIKNQEGAEASINTKNKLFCELAEDLGFITHEVTMQVLHEQKVDEAIGIKQPIGKYLFDSGHLNKEQISKILKVQKRVRSDA